MTASTLFSDYLSALGVPHTKSYADRLYRTMSFRSLFGLSKLFQQYGVESEGLVLEDKQEIHKLPVPFLARTGEGFVIVTGIDGDSIHYLTQGVPEVMPLSGFVDAWSGLVFMAYPAKESAEPDYLAHKRSEWLDRAKGWVLQMCVAVLFVYLFVGNGLYAHMSAWFITALDAAGLYLTYLLVQKSSNIRNRAADRFCRVLQEGGCDSILEMKASKFFGLFGWSEVGFAYFSVSLLAVLIFPQSIQYLALCNACCLPFTVWSIWYQKCRARVWCTLCVSVQCTLWLLFLCYLAGGWFKGVWPPGAGFWVLAVSYVTALLGFNRLMPMFDKSKPQEYDEN